MLVCINCTYVYAIMYLSLHVLYIMYNICMYVCGYVCMYVCMILCVYVHMFVCIDHKICLYTIMRESSYVLHCTMYILYACLYASIYVLPCMCFVSIYVCIYVCVIVYVYTFRVYSASRCRRSLPSN